MPPVFLQWKVTKYCEFMVSPERSILDVSWQHASDMWWQHTIAAAIGLSVQQDSYYHAYSAAKPVLRIYSSRCSRRPSDLLDQIKSACNLRQSLRESKRPFSVIGEAFEDTAAHCCKLREFLVPSWQLSNFCSAIKNMKILGCSVYSQHSWYYTKHRASDFPRLLVILHWIYRSACPLEFFTLLKVWISLKQLAALAVLRSALLWQAFFFWTDVKKFCVQHLKTKLSPQNCIEIWKSAENFGIQALIDEVSKFFGKTMGKISDQPQFLDLTKDDVSKLLAMATQAVSLSTCDWLEEHG